MNSSDPLAQLQAWLDEARAAGEPVPEATALATVTADGSPAVRMVMLRGLTFFTDAESDKGVELTAAPRVAAVMHWHIPVHRQVRLAGVVERVSNEEADAYWATRLRGRRIVMAASHQSRPRGDLRARVELLTADYPDDSTLPRPERWVGYRIVPETVEFWEEAGDGLHDRRRHHLGASGWSLEVLEP